jgi:hypothetical protein
MPIIQLRDGPIIRCLNDVLNPSGGDHVRKRTDEGTTMKFAESVVLQGVTQTQGKSPTPNGTGIILKPVVCTVCGWTELYNEKIALAPHDER